MAAGSQEKECVCPQQSGEETTFTQGWGGGEVSGLGRLGGGGGTEIGPKNGIWWAGGRGRIFGCGCQELSGIESDCMSQCECR